MLLFLNLFQQEMKIRTCLTFSSSSRTPLDTMLELIAKCLKTLWVKCIGTFVVGGVCAYVCWNFTLWRRYHNFHCSIWSSYTHVLYYLPNRKHPPFVSCTVHVYVHSTQTPTQHAGMLCRAGRHNLRRACICTDAPCSIWFILPLDGLDCGMLCTCTQWYMLKPGFCKDLKKKVTDFTYVVNSYKDFSLYI